ncbi:MAG: ABC transporter ATP-binding protein [SAR324 cluster bacterium]|uniref:ABC transporter ATP-binding protein n=1 Tax=SAR324 cluster bacterium TaxID=2024889 RepID=A0A7X9FSX1_9DELT|nr:ABC transporter ATP-binding protein [SAR324 cluster bacterium]
MTDTSRLALRVRKLMKSFGERCVVNQVSFDIHRGEVVGLLGPNGAGKTTTVGMLYGAVRKDDGEVLFSGIGSEIASREARRVLGVVTQEDRLDSDFSVIENLIQFAHRHRLTGSQAVERAESLLKEFGIEEYRNYSTDNLSGGLRRRLVLARALMHKPYILFLDEPTSGLDPDARQAFWTYISNLKDRGYAILLTTHYMDEAEKLCDRLLLIQNGSIIDEGAPSDVILRHAGEDALELEGLEESKLKELLPEGGVYRHMFDGGFLVSRPGGSVQELWRLFHDLDLPTLKRRRSNLEDVFLLMTGRGLD